jgi:hypothetical protein
VCVADMLGCAGRRLGKVVVRVAAQKGVEAAVYVRISTVPWPQPFNSSGWQGPEPPYGGHLLV